MRAGSPAYSGDVKRSRAPTPGGHTSHHAHPYEHLNVVLGGEGILRTADGDVDLAPGTMALILPDELHQFRNPGDTDLHIVCVVPNEFA